MSFDRVEFKPLKKPSAKPSAKPAESKLLVEEIENLAELIVRNPDLEQIATPIRFLYRDVEIRILEVTSSVIPDLSTMQMRKVYFVTLQIKYRNKLTKPFTLQVFDVNDLVEKLRVEIIRLKKFNLLIPDTVQQL